MSVVQELIPFNSACDDFIAGRYILADVKLTSLMKLISNDEKLADIVSSALKNYDFDKNFKNSIIDEENNMQIVLPTDDMQIIAYVFNLLYRFDNKIIKFYDFIGKYFLKPNETSGNEFQNFANAVIIPFKEAINNTYSKRHIIVDTNEYQNNYYNKIKGQIKLILADLDNYKLKMSDKEEFTMLLNALYSASDKNDKKTVFSLMIGLDYFTRYNKKLRNCYFAIEDCFNVN